MITYSEIVDFVQTSGYILLTATYKTNLDDALYSLVGNAKLKHDLEQFYSISMDNLYTEYNLLPNALKQYLRDYVHTQYKLSKLINK